MSSQVPSLLTFLDAPIVVGDPAGGATYVNPSFERRFGVTLANAEGCPLANLFEGGAREAILSAVEKSCARGETVRFPLRHEEAGFTAIASPIVADSVNVGVVILLMESSSADERALALHREIQGPLEDLSQTLEELFEQTGGRRAERHRTLVEEGIRALHRAEKFSEELHGLLTGKPRSAPQKAFDLGPAIQAAASRVAPEYDGGATELEVLMPGQIPAVRGEEMLFESALVNLLKARAEASAGDSVSVGVRHVQRDEGSFVLISVVDSPDAEGVAKGQTEEGALAEVVQGFGGEVRTTRDDFAGRTTAIRLQVA